MPSDAIGKDISSFVDYEFLYPLELVHPATDEPTGIVFMIRSAASEESKKMLHRHTNRNVERRMKNKMITGETLGRQELEKAASYIASWDWGTCTYNGEKPILSLPTAIAMMEKDSWIFQQVTEAANDVGNFSKSSK